MCITVLIIIKLIVLNKNQLMVAYPIQFYTLYNGICFYSNNVVYARKMTAK